MHAHRCVSEVTRLIGREMELGSELASVMDKLSANAAANADAVRGLKEAHSNAVKRLRAEHASVYVSPLRTQRLSRAPVPLPTLPTLPTHRVVWMGGMVVWTGPPPHLRLSSCFCCTFPDTVHAGLPVVWRMRGVCACLLAWSMAAWRRP